MLITVEEAKVFLEESDSSHDAQITAILAGLDTYIKKYMNKSIEQTTYIELYDGSGEKELLLDNYPIISITALSDDIDKDNKKYNSVIASGEILIHKTSGIIELYNQSFTESQKNIYIKYIAGYTTATIPNDLKMILYEMISKKWKDYQDKRYGMVSKSVLDENVSFSLVDVTDQQRQILNLYRKKPRIYGVETSEFSEAS